MGVIPKMDIWLFQQTLQNYHEQDTGHVEHVICARPAVERRWETVERRPAATDWLRGESGG